MFARVLPAMSFLLALGCSDQPLATSNLFERSRTIILDTALLKDEGELFGNIYNGSHNAYYVFLTPFSDEDDEWVDIWSEQQWSMWADSARHNIGGMRRNWAFEWIDPGDQGACGNTYADYLAGRRGKELHWDGPNLPPSSTATETHCIRPGKYWFRVYEGPPDPDKTPIKQFVVEYLSTAKSSTGSTYTVSDTTNGVTLSQQIEDTTTQHLGGVHDLEINVDLGASPGNDSPVLHIENAGNQPFKLLFGNQTTLSGSDNDWFRASVLRSQVPWNLNGRGRMLATIFWDSLMTNYGGTRWYNPDAHGTGLIRLKRYHNEVDSTRTVVAGAMLMQPHEAPNLIFQARRPISISKSTTVGPFASLAIEADSITEGTDMYLRTDRSPRGSDIQYRWRFDNSGAWTSFTTDTLFDFTGYLSTGTKTLTLEVRNVTTQRSDSISRSIVVSPGTTTIVGQQDIWVKTSYYYNSNRRGYYFERYNPETRFWGVVDTPEDSIYRIWPAGRYTVDLRQTDSVPRPLRRGRLLINVCIAQQQCVDPSVPLTVDAQMSSLPAARGSIFGAGPVVSVTGSAGSRRKPMLYGLMGGHGDNQFASVNWLDRQGGATVVDASTVLTWNRIDAGNGVRAFEFKVTNSAPHDAYTFGFAVDPDLGENPTDDRSGYDSELGMIYAFDDQRALGVVLRNKGDNALHSALEYGAKRFAPATTAALKHAQSQRGVYLLNGNSDVQFLLNAAARSGSSTFTVIIVDGSTLDDLRRTVRGLSF